MFLDVTKFSLSVHGSTAQWVWEKKTMHDETIYKGQNMY